MRVLIVEDEHKIAQALKKALMQENYAVDLSFDGDDGYAMATTEPYDLVVMDRMIPGKYNGLEIVKAMRDMKIYIPVIILTAKGTVNDRVNGLDAGADDYIVKPFALEELLARIRALLRRPIITQETILSAGNLTLNTLNYEVKRKNTKIDLTSKEFSLLEFLLRNQGRPSSKNYIISHVWDYDADILPNTVEVYIKYLRSKIDEPFKDPALIHTIRGFGYQIEDRSRQ
jgi:DNA-binding response OmpR family regulator